MKDSETESRLAVLCGRSRVQVIAYPSVEHRALASLRRFLLEQYVFVPINLNTASDADILTIPGVGARLLRELKEYRPYKAVDQFRREIGKYVSKQEVARFERYVTIN